MSLHLGTVASLIVALLLAGHARAQDCDCDHEIQPGPQTVVGSDLGVQPGDRICVMAGSYEYLRLQGIQGEEGSRVEIVNCGGLVRIHNDTRGYALVFEDDEAGNNSKHFHLNGAGDPALDYGFEISASAVDPWPGFGIFLIGRSTNYEVGYVEIHDTGFAGVSAKTDATCGDSAADQGNFTQYDIELHHMYIHETGGEAFYVGSTQSYGHHLTCDGVEEIHQPHFLEGVSIHHNLIENTQWDGAQIGMAHRDCAFYANTIRQVGLAGEEYQQQGLQIGTFSRCEVYRNVLEDGPTNGIFVMGAEDTRVYDNLVVGFGGDGIYLNHGDGDAADGATYEVDYNTVVDYGRDGIRGHSELLAGITVRNNLVVGPGSGVALGSEVNGDEAHNLTYAARDAAGFVGTDDYHLTDESPARGAGIAIDIEFDLDGMERADPPSVGAYEHAGDSPGPVGDTEGAPPPQSTGGAGSTVGSGSGASADSDDASAHVGCSCRAARTRTAARELAALLMLTALAWRRRGRFPWSSRTTPVEPARPA